MFRYKFSVTPREKDSLLKRLLAGKGREISIEGRRYVVREKGELPEEFREKLLSSAQRLAHQQGIKVSSKISCFIPYKVVFSEAEEIPPLEEDVGEHEYRIIGRRRYRVDFTDYEGVHTGDRSDAIQMLEKEIDSGYKHTGELPDKLVHMPIIYTIR